MMVGVFEKRPGQKIIGLLLIATTATIFVNIAILLLPLPFKSFFSETIQFLWPLLSIFLLARIHFSSVDPNVKYFTRFFAIALVPWTMTILLWELILPIFYNNDLAYYVSGFGFLLCYVVIIYGLHKLNTSRQWFIAPSTSSYVNFVGALLIIAVLSFVLLNIQWDSPRLPDVLILLLYLISDVLLLVLCSRLINTNMMVSLKYLVFVVAEFVLINSIADLLFEARWLLGLKQILSYKITAVIDPIYNLSLVFMTLSLLIYGTGLKDWALAKLGKGLDGRMLFVDDIVMHSPDAMFVSDGEGCPIIVNEAFVKLFNLSRSDIRDRFDIINFIGSQKTDIPVDIRQLKNGGIVSLPRVEIHPAGGAPARSVSVKIFPLLDSLGNLTNFVGIMEDITDRLRTEEELRESRQQIELYMDLMGHDINNMNQIGLGFLELAMEKLQRDGGIDCDSVDLIERPLESFKNSSRLISNIRKIQKIRDRELTLAPVDAAKAIEDAIGEFKDLQYRDVAIRFRPLAGMTVKADGLLKDVFTNLIGNAIKHSPPDRPLTIGIHVEEISDNGQRQYRICIDDTGPGIDDATKSALFTRLSRGNTRTKGFGLGLYLVKTLVEGYGGLVRVEDRVPGDHAGGSRFIIQLPAFDPADSSL
jgi:PAS domain S-box-containing protein